MMVLIEDWPSKALNIAEMMLPAGLTERALGLPFVEQSHLDGNFWCLVSPDSFDHPELFAA